jgi:outer membrane receptor protein involved in Fe transport
VPINPAQQVSGLDRYHAQSYEARISSPATNRLRFIGGLFYQRTLHRIHQQYIINGFNDSFEVSGHPDTIWLTEQLREDVEQAAFGEASFDFTESLTGSVGARVYKTENTLSGFFGYGSGFSSGTGEVNCTGPSPLAGAPCEDINKSTDESGTLYRVNLEYHLDTDRMVYATFSQGFRPGGINRVGTLPPYSADFLDNYEAGWKTEWFDHHLRFNGAVYLEKWRDFQFAFLGPNGLTEIQNAGNAQIVGIEGDLTWRPFQGLTISGSGTVLHSEMTNTTAFADKGTRLPTSPEVKADIVARYEFPLGDLNGFAQVGVVYQGDSTIDIRPAESALIGTLPAYWLTNLSFGFDQGDYRFTVFLDNLFNERAVNGRYTECATGTCFGQPYDVVGRPFTAGVRLGRSF